MKLFIIFLSALLIFTFSGCLANKSAELPLHIPVSEVEALTPMYTFAVSTTNVMAFFKHEKVYIGALIYVPEFLVIRYCYLDDGILIGYEIEREIHMQTGRRVYKLDQISDENILLMTEALTRISQGLNPFYDDKDKPDTI